MDRPEYKLICRKSNEHKISDIIELDNYDLALRLKNLLLIDGYDFVMITKLRTHYDKFEIE